MRITRTVLAAMGGLALSIGCTGSTGWSYLSECGNFGPWLEGVAITVPNTTTRTKIAVGERFRVNAVIGVPKDVVPPSSECPSATEGKKFFSRIKWDYAKDGPIRVELVSCDCTVEYERDFTGGPPRHGFVASASRPTVLVFDVIGERPGVDSFTVVGFVSGPCSGTDSTFPIECGPWSSAMAAFDVRATSGL